MDQLTAVHTTNLGWNDFYFRLFPSKLEQQKQKIKSKTPIDLAKFAGKWYEICALPRTFQKGCSNTTTEYTLIENNNNNNTRFKVRNEAVYSLMNSPIHIAIEGEADLNAEDPMHAELIVYLFPHPKIRHAITPGANLCIIHMEDNYAMVGSPHMHGLWFLSRTPTMPPPIVSKFRKIAEELGFNVGKLVDTEQTPPQEGASNAPLATTTTTEPTSSFAPDNEAAASSQEEIRYVPANASLEQVLTTTSSSSFSSK